MTFLKVRTKCLEYLKPSLSMPHTHLKQNMVSNGMVLAFASRLTFVNRQTLLFWPSLSLTRNMPTSTKTRLIRWVITILMMVAKLFRSFNVHQVWIQAVWQLCMAMKVVWQKMASLRFAVVSRILILAKAIMHRCVFLSMATTI